MIEIPNNNDGCELTRAERIDIIAQVMLRGCDVSSRINSYGGGKIERLTYTDKDGSTTQWYDVVSMAGCNDSRYGHEVLFLPSDSEINDALELFREKGWHAYYDSEMHRYGVSKELHSRGAYVDRFTHWMF